MKFLLSALFTVVFTAALCAQEAPLNTLTEAEKKDGWKLLFDGKDASAQWRGYKMDKLPDGWKVENGALVRHDGPDIVTKDEYESFELAVDWKISEGGNSGIMFKVQETDGPPYVTGPEAQILDNLKGGDPQKAGWMYALYPASVDTTKPVGEWNHFVLKCAKTPAGTYKCEHWMNGTKYVEYEIGSEDWNARVAKSKFAAMPGFAKSAKGHICLQDHGAVVSFRNIKLRVLP
jgi:hypothetical protein